MTPVEAFIRQAAKDRGIDPDIAVKYAMTEGGVDNPFRQSDITTRHGGREPSFGAFQLNLEGGLGAEMLKSGHDPRKDWKAGIEYALDTVARKHSWADFHGVADSGFSNTGGLGPDTKPMGIGTTLTSTKYGGTGAAAFPIPSGPEAPSGVQPGLSAPGVPSEPGAPVPAAPAAPGTAAGAGGNLAEMMKGLGSLAGAFGGRSVSDPSANQIIQPSIDINRPSASAAAQMMAALMEERRKRYAMGTTLTSGGPGGV